MYKKPVQADDTFWRLEVDINPGKLDDFIGVAHDLFLQIGNRSSSAECLMEQGWLALRAGAAGVATTVGSAGLFSS